MHCLVKTLFSCIISRSLKNHYKVLLHPIEYFCISEHRCKRSESKITLRISQNLGEWRRYFKRHFFKLCIVLRGKLRQTYNLEKVFMRILNISCPSAEQLEACWVFSCPRRPASPSSSARSCVAAVSRSWIHKLNGSLKILSKFHIFDNN